VMNWSGASLINARGELLGLGSLIVADSAGGGTESPGNMFVTRVSPEGPADKAGLKSGDILVGFGGNDVSSLADFYQKVWALGAAGVEVPLRVLQGVQVKEVTLHSIDRVDYFRARPSY